MKSRKMFYSTVIFFSFFCLGVTNAIASADPIVKIILNDGTFYAGDSQMLAAVHDENGSRSNGYVSGNWRDVKLNLASLGEKNWVVVAVQLTGGKNTHLASIRRVNHKTLTIDNKGLICPDDSKKVLPDGPFVVVSLNRTVDGQEKQINPMGLGISAKNILGINYPSEVLENGDILIKKVLFDSPFTIHLKNNSANTWKYKLYPYLRSSIPDLLNYKIMDVPLGELVPQK